jgi:hypothetical protein
MLAQSGPESARSEPANAAAGRASALKSRLILALALVASLDVSGLLPMPLGALEPHPYWIAVVLIALLHGTLPGLATAAIAALAHLASGSSPFVPGQDFYDWQLRAWREPVLWLLTATALGELRRRHDGVVAELKSTLARAETERRAVFEHARRLREHIGALEHEIALGDDRLEALCDLAELEDMDLERRAERIAATARRLLGASAARVLARGRAPDEPSRRLLASLLDAGRPLLADDPADAPRLGGAGALAVAFATRGERPDAAILLADLDPELDRTDVRRLAKALAACAAGRPREEPDEASSPTGGLAWE